MQAQRHGNLPKRPKAKGVDCRSAEVEVRSSEPQASGAVGGEVSQIARRFPEPWSRPDQFSGSGLKPRGSVILCPNHRAGGRSDPLFKIQNSDYQSGSWILPTGRGCSQLVRCRTPNRRVPNLPSRRSELESLVLPQSKLATSAPTLRLRDSALAFSAPRSPTPQARMPVRIARSRKVPSAVGTPDR